MTDEHSPVVTTLVRILDEAFHGKSWHGTSLRGSVRGLDAATAVRRPAKGRHSIAELVLHAAYWKYAVRRRLTGEKRGAFYIKGSNWFPVGREFGAEEWARAVHVLHAEHEALRSAVSALREKDVDQVAPGGRAVWTFGQLVSGAAAHDLYHAGQIQLVKRLLTDR